AEIISQRWRQVKTEGQRDREKEGQRDRGTEGQRQFSVSPSLHLSISLSLYLSVPLSLCPPLPYRPLAISASFWRPARVPMAMSRSPARSVCSPFGLKIISPSGGVMATIIALCSERMRVSLICLPSSREPRAMRTCSK